MQKYVLGFMFDFSGTQVLLIQKNQPAWQAGKLNGVGGKVEEGESFIEAMCREFSEEAGITTTPDQWKPFASMTGDDDRSDFIVEVFVTSGRLHDATALTSEQLQVVDSFELPVNTLPSVRSMIPLILHHNEVTFGFNLHVRKP